ncbi:spore protease YyaC [Virgibacillus siamensis]|uniref:spore protease YyaC n=1 Tax=Virgibacillus siamensis TaxID=480071 RepID=UPI000986F3E3|nr:spore protease YyaC [Virgibacillus siamensis]
MNLMNRFEAKNNKLQLLYNNPVLKKKMSDKIISFIPDMRKDCIIVCIGTDRSTGDALGPLIGSYLLEKNLKTFTVYGTLPDPVHAVNLKDYLTQIEKQHDNPFIIAVDASLGKTAKVGSVILDKGPLLPGAAVNKDLPPVGDIHITGVVNKLGFMEYSILQNTRLSTVVEIAKKTADILHLVDELLSVREALPETAMAATKKTLQ